MSKNDVAKACLQSLCQKRGVPLKFERFVPAADVPNEHCRPDSEQHAVAALPVQPPAEGLAPLATEFLVFLMSTGAAPVGTITNAIVLVTPAIAHAWLRTNHNNRNPSTAKIGRYAAAMKAGKWTLTGEPVKFDTAGQLLDGQSRLRSIIRSDTSVQLEVRWGLPRAAQESMDTGEARSHAHQLQMAGIKYSSAIAAAVRVIWIWEQGGTPVGDARSTTSRLRAIVDNTTIRETYERHPGIAQSVVRYASAAQSHKLLPLSRVAAYHYIFSTIDRARADRFWDGVSSGTGLEAGTPVHQLRERLVADRLSQVRISVREQSALIIKAWGAYYRGERLQRLTFRIRGDDPEAFPPIAGDSRSSQGSKAGAA